MRSTINSPEADREFDRIAEVAGYLWQRNWAECNGGNISINLTDLADKSLAETEATQPATDLAAVFPALAGNILYLTGAGTRMRDVAKSPLGFGVLIRITGDGRQYEFISEPSVQPTSELASHVSIHNHLITKGKHHRAILHTHPTELIALTHCKPFLDSTLLTRILWSMIPETRIIVPGGIGIVPYKLTGTKALAEATITMLEKHEIVLWEKHGILAVGTDIDACFDKIDALSKSALIYLNAKRGGFEPEGLTDSQLDELASAFNL